MYYFIPTYQQLNMTADLQVTMLFKLEDYHTNLSFICDCELVYIVSL